MLGPDIKEERLLCPIRVSMVYLERTKELRRNTSLLFISVKPNFGRDVRGPTISAWNKKVISVCYRISKAIPPGPLKVGAHDVRAPASSLAYLPRCLEEEC